MSRSRTRLLLAAVLVVALVVAGGCSSSSKKSSSSSSSSTPSTTSSSTGASSTPGGASTPSTMSTPTTASTAAGGGTSSCTKPPGAKAGTWSAEPKVTVKPTDKLTATLTTSDGVMVAQLMPDQGLHAVNNFVFLARHGFYTCIPFHRIMKGFMVQTGDPDGTGTGGPGYTIADDAVKMSYAAGILAMANTGAPHSGGSQFFIVQGNGGSQLSPSYPIFGKVTTGMDVLDKIASTPVGPAPGTGEPSAPQTPVWLESVKIS
jgi:cyclophilin family peptidyl-prolyl cis-trans isomerase